MRSGGEVDDGDVVEWGGVRGSGEWRGDAEEEGETGGDVEKMGRGGGRDGGEFKGRSEEGDGGPAGGEGE